MQQLKLLNFYKILANVATNLVGAFIPLIVLQATGSVAYGMLSIILMYGVRILFNFLFRNLYEKYPQIILLLRIVTVLGYSVSIILIDSYLWVGIIGAVLFYGIDNSFKCLPIEILFNYSSSESGEEKSPLGFSRLMEQVGVLIALVVGGVMLDVDKTLITIISIVIYGVSVIPLVVYYIKSHKLKTFNKDAVSNAQLLYEKNPELNKKSKDISKKVLIGYTITYFFFCLQDVLGNAFNIHIFLETSSYGSAGYINALYNACYGLGCYLFSYFDSKKDTTPLIIVSGLVSGLVIIGIVLFQNFVWYYVAMAVLGVLFGFICTYALSRLLPKCRIMGVSNEALFFRENTSDVSVIFATIFGLWGSMVPVFICIAVGDILSSIVLPLNEEYSRKQLIKYLQNHEKIMSNGIKMEYENPQNDIIVLDELNNKKPLKTPKTKTASHKKVTNNKNKKEG